MAYAGRHSATTSVCNAVPRDWGSLVGVREYAHGQKVNFLQHLLTNPRAGAMLELKPRWNPEGGDGRDHTGTMSVNRWA